MDSFIKQRRNGMNMYVSFTVFILAITTVSGQLEDLSSKSEESEESWTGRWMPHPPYSDVVTKQPTDLHDDKHGIVMGVKSNMCDDAKTNLTLDWDFSPSSYTCYMTKKIEPDYNIKPVLDCEHIPKYYVAYHKCMNATIEYDSPVPTFGTHRPLWAKYGEYRYLPKQRWVHNLEHGGVVMLYHPCADPLEVNRLRYLVKNCLRRHIITPLVELDEKRPFALVVWGCRLTMSTVNPKIVLNFIKKRALQGPEKISSNGQYNLELRVPAEIVSDIEDSTLCPKLF